MSKKTKFPELRAELRQREAHSKTIAKRIRETSGEERMRLWEQKREYGSVTRYVLLAYALLRGLPRSSQEPAHQPDAWMLAQCVHANLRRFGHELERAAVADWLKATPEQKPGDAVDPATWPEVISELKTMTTVTAERDFATEPEPFI